MKRFVLLGVGLLLLALVLSSVYVVQAGQRGVLITFGNPSDIPSSEGLHFKIPIAQKVVKMDIKTQKYEAHASAASRDLQIVTAKIAVNYHLTPEQTPRLYREVGIGYQDRVIQPSVQETIKSVTARFTAEELITRRADVKELIQVELRERLIDRGIIVEEISITDFDFSESFNVAIEEKVVAEQRKLRAERDLERIRIEAEQKVVQAQAEAESIRIQSLALQQSQDILQLRFIEKWDGVMPYVYSTGNGGISSLINIP